MNSMEAFFTICTGARVHGRGVVYQIASHLRTLHAGGGLEGRDILPGGWEHLDRRRKDMPALWHFLFTVSVSVLAAQTAYGAFPGANGRIVFASDRDGGRKIYTMNPDGTDVVQLTNSAATEQTPSWSADGTKIAFTSDRDGDDEIYVMCADGTGQTRRTLDGANDFSPTWSPDGSRIAFASGRDGNDEIYVMYADGTDQHSLTLNPLEDSAPSWSPDGSRIVFVRGATPAGREIWVMNADGSGQTQLTMNGVQDTLPKWSPDGSKIVFRRELAYGDGWGELFMMNPDGTGQFRYADTPTLYEGEAAWSPDGTQLALNRSPGNFTLFEIYVGSNNITNSPGYDGDIDWQAIPSTGPVEVSPPSALIPFTLSKSGTDRLDMGWEVACAPTYRIVSGSLSSIQPFGVTTTNALPLACGIVGSTTNQPMPMGSVFLLVVGDNGVGTGSLGNASSGEPRVASLNCP